MSRTIVLSLYLLLRSFSKADLPQLGPSFIVEPPSLVQYPVNVGVKLSCSARGDPKPTLTWISDDGTPVTDLVGVRRVYTNGSLEILPSSSYRSSLSSFRCRAVNVHGTVLSREVTLQPVADDNWEALLTAPTVLEGGTAALTCGSNDVPSQGLVKPAVWYRGDRVLNAERHHPDARYLIAGNTMLIREVSAADGDTYSCLARHTVTGVTKRSKPVHLVITPGTLGTAPRLIASSGELSVPAGTDFCVPCVATSQPPSQYTWYKEVNGRLQPVDFKTSSVSWLWGEGSALCSTRTSKDNAGAWLCKAFNMYGDTTSQMRIEVLEPLIVTVSPTVHVADTGSSVKFNCTTDSSAIIRWLHDGVPVGSGSKDLYLRGVTRSQRGMYQCIARLASQTAQATAELRLGDTVPELHYTFIEQALRSGGSVSLRCAASGSPAPRFVWLLDGQPVDQYLAVHRYSINEETSISGDVVSVLNVSTATAADGGRYTCKAQNSLGQATHSARLNIYGTPSIRALGPVRVVAGANTTVFCPYAGYPISSISWWARGAERALSNSGRISARGAELRLFPALPTDAGPYACSVAAPDGTAARRDIELQVRNPPKISPFIFSSELTEGSSVQVLCGVSTGDKPMYFSWFKDGAPISTTLQIQEKSLDEFSLLMFSDLTAKHSGEYTCRVSNHAATVNYTATLSVKVAPTWASEPLDSAVLLGAPISLECAAKGYPYPVVTWFRKIGNAMINSEGSSEQWEEVQNVEWSTASMRSYNGTLTSSSASRAHQGTYRCKADNGVGPALLKYINITVHEPAHFDTSDGTNARNVTCTRGQGATMTCHALGDTPLRVHWAHKGRRLDLNSYRATVSEIRTADGLRSSLQLRSVEREDAGEYRCHAENEYGRSELLMYLHVEEPPEAPRALRLGGTGSRWVRLSWRTTPSRGVAFAAIYTALHALAGTDARQKTVNLTTEPIIEDRLDPDGTALFLSRLQDLRPATAYSLRIMASNHVGQSPNSEPLMFTTLEEGPTGSPQKVNVRPTGTGELHVEWSAPPQDSWNGELLGYVITWRELGRFDDEQNESEDRRRSGSITSPGWSSSEITLNGLRKYARYAVAVKAYNSAGAGPPSHIVYASTDEAPNIAPLDVRCEPLSSKSLRVRWTSLGSRTVTPQPIIGYDVVYAAQHVSHSWNGALSEEIARSDPINEATLLGLRRDTNYSVSVRVRGVAAIGPPTTPIYCSTLEDVPGSPEKVRALPVSADGVLVSWLAPTDRGGKLTHYTLYIRELGKSGGEWSQRVDNTDIEDDSEELSQEVRGLREQTVYEFWVRGSTMAGPGERSRHVTASPNAVVSARIASFGRIVRIAEGARVRLRCVAVGTAPLSRNWKPLPRSHTLTEAGDLLIHRLESSVAGNYTCSIRNSFGTDKATYTLRVLLPPSTPSPRLARADTHALHLTWDPPQDGGTPLLGYTVWWSRLEGTEPKSIKVPGSDTTHTLEGLACGAQYRVTLRAHNAVGISPHSRPLVARTRGDKAKAALAKEFIWANSTHLRFNLLAWAARCPVTSWTVAVRATAGGPWRNVIANGEAAEANGLRSGTWYEVRVVARSPAGDTTALYRAATYTHNGERIGEPIEVPLETSNSIAGGATDGIDQDDWRSSLAPALLGGGLAAFLALLAALMLIKRKRAPQCLQRSCSMQQVCQPHPQLYTTEPGKRNGKTLSPPDGDIHEISPYATFSMAGGANAVGDPARCTSSCLLHLRTFGRAESMDLAAPPSRPNLLRHSDDYARAKHSSGSRETDSDSSGSPCAECAAELYRVPTAHLSDTLPVVESSAEDTSYSAGGGRPTRGTRVPRGRRRREHARHSSGPTARYFSSATLQARQEAL